MNVADYFTATIPEPWQILGLRLRPFSLGHYKLLKRFNCAFVADVNTTVGLSDLTIGVLVCSMQPSEFLRFMESPNFSEKCKEWGKSVGVFDINAKSELFAKYISSHSVVPKYWEESQGKSSGAHWAHCLEVTLRGKLGWSQDEVDNEPLSKALAHYFKHAENEGMIRLMTKEELEFIEESNVKA